MQEKKKKPHYFKAELGDFIERGCNFTKDIQDQVLELVSVDYTL
jgi:hypothetical protein